MKNKPRSLCKVKVGIGGPEIVNAWVYLKDIGNDLYRIGNFHLYDVCYFDKNRRVFVLADSKP